MPKIICTVGLSNSGKSTWANEEWNRLFKLNLPCAIVCRDDIHRDLHGERYDSAYDEKVSSEEIAKVEWLIDAEFEVVIIDACHYKRKYRDRWRKICNEYGWKLEFKIFDTPVKECIRRAEAKGDDVIIPIIKEQAAEADFWEGVEDD